MPKVHNAGPLTIAGRTFRSRLILGTGKYPNFSVMRDCYTAAEIELVTVAVRRVDWKASGEDSILNFIDTKAISLLPNTAGCYDADSAVRTCHLAAELGLSRWVKLEVLGDEKTLYPDVVETLVAARRLVKEGFVVLPYTSDDVITARKLEDCGCAAVMPLASPIGSGLGIRNPHNISLILEAVKVPVIVDAGVGTASDAAIAMELGCDGILMNTAVALAREPVRMARAMRLAVEGARSGARWPHSVSCVRLRFQPGKWAHRALSAGIPFRVILVTDWSIPELLPRLRDVLAVPGPLALQHRHPQCTSEQFSKEASELAALCQPRAVPLFINGSLDTALSLGAHLHLPVGISSAKEARARLPPGRLISIAAHQASELQPEADIALISPVFPTGSKPGAAPLGPQGFHRLAAGSRLTAFALGGISPERIGELQPVAGVAVMSNVLRAQEPARAMERLFAALRV